MSAPNGGRRRNARAKNRKVFGVNVDAELVQAVGRLEDLGIVANRSAAVEEGLRMLVAIHNARLAERMTGPTDEAA